MTPAPDSLLVFEDAIIQEIQCYSDTYGPLSVDTIYWGGGTPNVLSKQSYTAIMTALNTAFRITEDAEITMEMNPGIHDHDMVSFFQSTLAINRVSIGAQSFDANVLSDYGRNHTKEETHWFIQTVFDTGLVNVSCDIIFGHPHHLRDSLTTSLQALDRYPFQHISLYGLTIEPHTPYDRQNMTVDPDHQADDYIFIQDWLNEKAFEQYEVSNFSKNQCQSRHNIKYWTGQPTIGLGPSAHSYFLGHRYANAPDLRGYIHELHNRLPTEPNPAPNWNEFIASRIRYRHPIPYSFIHHTFPNVDIDALRSQVNQFHDDGLLLAEDDAFSVTKRGFLLIDELLFHFVVMGYNQDE